MMMCGSDGTTKVLEFFTRVSARVSVQKLQGGHQNVLVVVGSACVWRGSNNKKCGEENNEEGSETPKAPIQLRKRELALPHRARATSLATTPGLLTLVRMW